MIRDKDLRQGEQVVALRAALKGHQLHDALAARGLPVSGTKAEQAERLVEAGYTLQHLLDGTVHEPDGAPVAPNPLADVEWPELAPYPGDETAPPPKGRR